MVQLMIILMTLMIVRDSLLVDGKSEDGSAIRIKRQYGFIPGFGGGFGPGFGFGFGYGIPCPYPQQLKANFQAMVTSYQAAGITIPAIISNADIIPCPPTPEVISAIQNLHISLITSQRNFPSVFPVAVPYSS